MAKSEHFIAWMNFQVTAKASGNDEDTLYVAAQTLCCEALLAGCSTLKE